MSVIRVILNYLLIWLIVSNYKYLFDGPIEAIPNLACAKHHETFHHALNDWKRIFDRYRWLHNSVLIVYFKPALNYIVHLNNILILVIKKGIFIISSDNLVTAQRSDLLCINRPTSSIFILDLIICFKTNFDAAHKKVPMYSLLTTYINTKGNKVNFCCCQKLAHGVS